MSEAKYKVGQEMTSPEFFGPRKITSVKHFYQLQPTDALWSEDELTHYVRPLAVGDRVRHKYAGSEGVIDAIRGPKASVWACEQWNVWAIANIERIPEEAGK